MSPAVIVGAARTPIGAFQGAFAELPAWRLGAAALTGALARGGLAAAEVTDVVLGNVLSAGQGQAPARRAVLAANLAASVRATTVHKVCGSGLQAVMQSAHALGAGLGALYLAGGMESMTQAPYLLAKARSGYRLGHGQLLDSVLTDGLWDPHGDQHMGSCAEACAVKYGFSRAEQDAYAAESFRRALRAQEAGAFAEEIVAVDVPAAKGATVKVAVDEGPARVNFDRMPTLRPAFSKDGTITAANASSINDGAAVLAVAREDTAAARGWRPVARITGMGIHAQEPLWFTTAPVEAARRAMAAAGWGPNDVDLWEVNEAFAVVPLAFMRELGIGAERVNVDGGAIALGHPIGASGARIVVTLLGALQRRGLRRGVAAICIGGGEGLALCVERM
ncbi:MAG: thiolase family protein [Verrucomicrobia bacterium]|nr:thiolase family protein [Verrucomicrobiota bacterium]